jgi:hypothetical protein
VVGKAIVWLYLDRLLVTIYSFWDIVHIFIDDTHVKVSHMAFDVKLDVLLIARKRLIKSAHPVIGNSFRIVKKIHFFLQR